MANVFVSLRIFKRCLYRLRQNISERKARINILNFISTRFYSLVSYVLLVLSISLILTFSLGILLLSSSPSLNTSNEQFITKNIIDNNSFYLIEKYRKKINTLKLQIKYLKKLSSYAENNRFCLPFKKDFYNHKISVFNNEYEMIPYSYFTLNKIYSPSLNLGKRVAEKPIGNRKIELNEIIDTSIRILNLTYLDLNNHQHKHRYKQENKQDIHSNLHEDKYIKSMNSLKSLNLMNGIIQNDPYYGTYYHLFFKISSLPSSLSSLLPSSSLSSSLSSSTSATAASSSSLISSQTPLLSASSSYSTYSSSSFSSSSSSTSSVYHQLSFIKPLTKPILLTNKIISTDKQIIYLIVPLNEIRLENLNYFLNNLNRFDLKNEISKRKLKIIISYYGNLVLFKSKIKSNLIHKIINISFNSNDFNRANALQIASSIICSENDKQQFNSINIPDDFKENNNSNNSNNNNNNDCLLFFCDADIIFTKNFLERCRLNTIKGNKVYYPIVFSFYNPKYTKINLTKLNDHYNHNNNYDYQNNRMNNMITSENGFWRDFGFGMTCQYRSDFFNVKGFIDDRFDNNKKNVKLSKFNNKKFYNREKYLKNNEHLKREKHSQTSDKNIKISHQNFSTKISWGGEDVLLYRKHLKSSTINVIRSTDPGIFHIWHNKDCDNLKLSTKDQLRSCLNSKALNEASQIQLVELLNTLEKSN